VLLDVTPQTTLALSDSHLGQVLLQEVEGSLSLCLGSLQSLLTFADTAAAAAPAATGAAAPQDNGWLEPLVSSLETVLKTIQVSIISLLVFGRVHLACRPPQPVVSASVFSPQLIALSTLGPTSRPALPI
jgi:hypothetical protein